MSKPYNGFTTEQRKKGGDWYRRRRRSGLIPAPKQCCCCGQTNGVNGHSEDYSEPFGPHIGFYELCYRCHMAVHCRLRNFKAFERYREAIKTRTFRATRDFRVFIVQFQSFHDGVAYFERPIPAKHTFLDELPNRHLTPDELVSMRRAIEVAEPVKVEQKDLFGG